MVSYICQRPINPPVNPCKNHSDSECNFSVARGEFSGPIDGRELPRIPGCVLEEGEYCPSNTKKPSSVENVTESVRSNYFCFPKIRKVAK